MSYEDNRAEFRAAVGSVGSVDALREEVKKRMFLSGVKVGAAVALCFWLVLFGLRIVFFEHVHGAMELHPVASNHISSIEASAAPVFSDCNKNAL